MKRKKITGLSKTDEEEDEMTKIHRARKRRVCASGREGEREKERMSERESVGGGWGGVIGWVLGGWVGGWVGG